MSSSIVFGILLVSIAMVYAKPDTAESKFAPILPGNCPDFTPVSFMDGLKISQLDGEWNGVYFVKSGFQNKGTIKCVKNTITSKPDGSAELVISEIKDDQQKSINIHALPISGQPGKFTIRKDTTDASESNISRTGTILEGDKNILVDVICGTNGTHHGFTASVYSRQTTLNAAKLEKVKATLIANNIKDELKAIEAC